jgi:hypothetical protein
VTPSRKFFRLTDVARIWGEEAARVQARAAGKDESAAVAAARPVSESAVRKYRVQSLRGRYAAQPMPLPIYPDDPPKPGQQPLWVPEDGETLDDLERRLRAWWHARPGAGVGGGRPMTMTPEQVRLARQMLDEPGATHSGVARQLGVARSTLYRHLRKGQSE